MTEFFEDGAVCLIPAEMVRGENLSEILLPVFCSQANTEGGTVIIGAARASDGSVVVEGVPSISETRLLVDKLISDKSRISVSTIKSVIKIREGVKEALKIEVAPAPWTERPVYINSDPIHGVYRNFEGEKAVFGKKFITMMAEDSVDIQRDNKRLEHFYESVVDFKALERYRKLHREKRHFPKWDILDNESFMERISAKSEGRLLRAGLLMFGENKNVSFCLRRKINGTESKFEANNIWSFIELVLPVFDRRDEPECRQALLEAFFNSLIHADYSFGYVETAEESGQISFINSGIPRSSDNSSVCRNLRIMKMLCLVGYAKNKGSGMDAIKNYSGESKLSVDYDKWQTEITIPVKSAKQAAEPARNGVPHGFYPVVELIKANTSEESEIADPGEILEEAAEETSFGDSEHIIISVPEETEEPIAESHDAGHSEDAGDQPAVPDQIDTEEEDSVIDDEDTQDVKNVIFDISDNLNSEEQPDSEPEPDQISGEQEGVGDLKESEQGKLLEQVVKEYRMKSAFNQNTELFAKIDANADLDQNIPPDADEDEPAELESGAEQEDVFSAVPTVSYSFENAEEDVAAVPDEDTGDAGYAESAEDTGTAGRRKDVQTSGTEGKKKKSRIKTAKPKPLRVVMGNLIEDENETAQVSKKKQEENKKARGAEKTKKSSKNAEKNNAAAAEAEAEKIPAVKEPADYSEIRSGIIESFSGAVKMVRENSLAPSAMVKDALFEYCNEFRTTAEISAALLRPESSVKRLISRMIKEGKLERDENNACRSVSNIKGAV